MFVVVLRLTIEDGFDVSILVTCLPQFSLPSCPVPVKNGSNVLLRLQAALLANLKAYSL